MRRKWARDAWEGAAWLSERTGQEQRRFGSLSDAAQTWDRRRRLIVKAAHTARGANPRFVVTQVLGDAHALDEQVSCQRGAAENRITQQQRDLFANRTSCHRFLAHPFRLLWSAAASLLVQELGPVEVFHTVVPLHDGRRESVWTAVLLPPGAARGDRLPTVVTCYGGHDSFRSIQEYGG